MDPRAYYLHRISPYIIRFSGNFGIRWYGAAYVAGFIVAIILLRRLSRLGRIKLTYQEIDALLTYLVIGVLLGGRVGYVLFYEIRLLFQLESSFPFWGLLAVNQGGMSSHGGFIGVGIMLYFFSRRHKIPILHLGDAVLMAAPPGLFFGRMANFINGELFGRPASAPWAVCFPTEIMNWPSEKIMNLYSVLSEKGFVFRDAGNVLDAVIRSDAVAAIVHPYLTPRHPSQIYEALVEGLILFLILWWFGKRAKLIGRVSAVFFWAYGLMRIFAEQFREPDVGIGFQWLGLTRGQWLCMAMLVAGGAIWYAAQKKNLSIKDIPKREESPPHTKRKKKKKR